jgi:hypothetical protein
VASTYLSQANAASTYLSTTAATATYLTQANATSIYAPLASPTLTGTPSATTPANGSNNTTRIPTTAWVQSYFGNLASTNGWSSLNYMSGGLAVGFGSGSLASGAVLDVSRNTHVSGSIDAGDLQVNGVSTNDATQIYAKHEFDTALVNHTSVVMVDGVNPSNLTLTLPKVNNNIGVQIVSLQFDSRN